MQFLSIYYIQQIYSSCPACLIVQLLSRVWLFVTPWTAACQASLSFTISQSLLKLMSIELVMPSNHLSRCHPLIFLPLIFPSIRVFSSESAFHIRWSNYWCFNINPSNEYSELISFRIDWFVLLDVQETLKSLLQHHNSKASVLRHSVFFMVQLSHPYTTKKNHHCCCSVVSDSLDPRGLQHIRLPCPSPSPRVCSNSCPLNPWCHPTISSSVFPFPPAFNLSQHQGLFQWVGSLYQMTIQTFVSKVMSLLFILFIYLFIYCLCFFFFVSAF